MRIPPKPNAYSEGSQTAFQDSERSDGDISIVQEAFGVVKETIRSAAEGDGRPFLHARLTME